MSNIPPIGDAGTDYAEKVNAYLASKPILATSEGADPTGGSVARADLQASLDTVPTGGAWEIPPGTYKVDAPGLSTNGKRIAIICRGQLLQVGDDTNPILHVQNGPDSVIDGLNVVGAEDASTFLSHADTVMSQRAAVKATLSDGVVIGRLVVTGKSLAAYVDTCHKYSVRTVRNTGFGTPGLAAVNYHSTVFIRGGNDGGVKDVRAKSVGDAVAVGNTALRGSITDIHGEDCVDNFIYISSGHGWSISDFTSYQSVPTGSSAVKTRGNGHSISNGHIEGHQNGITMSPLDGSVADAYGSGGHSASVETVTIENVQAYGILLSSITGSLGQQLFLRDAAVIGCPIIGSGLNPALAAAAIGTVGATSMTIIGNPIENCQGAAVILLEGLDAAHRVSHTVLANRIRNATGRGILAEWADDGIFSFNRFRDVALEGLLLLDCDNNDTTHNKKLGTGSATVVKYGDDSGSNHSTGNRPFANVGTVVDTHSGENMPVLTGSKGGNAALGNLTPILAAAGLLVDSTT